MVTMPPIIPLILTLIFCQTEAEQMAEFPIDDDNEPNYYEHHIGESIPNFGSNAENAIIDKKRNALVQEQPADSDMENIPKWARSNEHDSRTEDADDYNRALQEDEEFTDNYDELERQLKEAIDSDGEAYETENRKKRSLFSQDHQGCWGGTAVTRPFPLRRYRDGNHNSLCTEFCTAAGYNVASTRYKMCGCSYGLPNPIITRPEIEEFVKVCNFTCPGSRAHALGLSCEANECCGGPAGYTVSLMSEIDTTKVMTHIIWQEVRERTWSVTQIERIQKRSVPDEQTFMEKDAVQTEHKDESRATCMLNCGSNGVCRRAGSKKWCECSNGFSGSDCSHVCTKDCTTHGKCYISKGKHLCECKSGWEGDNCEIQNCFKECKNGGSCITVNEQSLCQCAKSFGAHDCSKPCDLDCEHNGRCIVEDFGPICTCPPGRGGKTCHQQCTKKCHNEGYCYVDDGTQKCKCKPHFTGSACERATKYNLYCQPFEDEPNLQDPQMSCPLDTAIDVISAAYTRHSSATCTSYCQQNAELIVTRRKRSSFSPCAICDKGKDDDSKSRNMTYIKDRCQNKPRCEFKWGSENFKHAFAMDRCDTVFKYVEFEYDCMPDLIWQNPCDANPGPCRNGGQCFGDKSTQTYTCSCINGWKGTKCTISPLDPCDDHPCLNDGTCVPDKITQTYTCQCKEGYQGATCDIPPGSVLLVVNKPMVLSACFPAAITIDTVCVSNEDPLTCWRYLQNQGITGLDTKDITTGISLEECKNRCIFETEFHCASIEYRSDRCGLSIANSKNAGNHLGWVTSFGELHERVQCGDETAVNVIGRKKRESEDAEIDPCSPGSKLFGEYCYKISDTTADFETARVECKADFGDLVSIHSSAQESHVLSMMEERGLTDMWIGMQNSISEIWYWCDGSVQSFQTSLHMKLDQDDEKCIQLQQTKVSGVTQNSYLDVPCSYKFHFMCKSKAINLTATDCRRDPRALQRLKRQCDGKRTCDIEPVRILASIDTIFSPPKYEPEPEMFCWETQKGKALQDGQYKKTIHDISVYECKMSCEREKDFPCKSVTYHRTTVRKCGLSDKTRDTLPSKYSNKTGATYYGRVPCPICIETYNQMRIEPLDASSLGEGEKLSYREEKNDIINLADCYSECAFESRCMSFEYHATAKQCILQSENRRSAAVRFTSAIVNDYTYNEKTLCSTLEISYTCTSKYVHVACSGNMIEAACAAGFIQVEEAWYGRVDSHVCPTPELASATCFRTITERVKNYCDYERECSVNIKELDVAWMDPCIGTEKYLVVTHSCQPTKTCPNDYVYNSLTLSCYKVVGASLVPWHIAKDNCEQDGKDLANSITRSHLVGIISEMEQKIVHNLVRASLHTRIIDKDTPTYWIGLHDQNNERGSSKKKWEWWNGEPYSNQWNMWYSKDSTLSKDRAELPDEPSPGNNDYDHVVMSAYYNGQWLLNKEKNGRALYVCEYKPYAQPCTKGYFYSEDTRSCYKVYLEKENLWNSLTLCYEEQAYLASIMSLREQVFIQDLINQAQGYMSGGQYWIGRFVNRWYDGEDLIWNNWYKNGSSQKDVASEPDGTGMFAYLDATIGGQWFDSQGTGTAYRICKMKPPYVIKINIITLVANEKNDLIWKQCVMEEKRSKILYYCSEIDPPDDKGRFMHLKLTSVERQVEFKQGRNLAPLGEYDFLMENPTNTIQRLRRQYKIDSLFEESLFVESGQTVASTKTESTSITETKTVEHFTNVRLQAAIGKSFGIQVGGSFQGAWENSLKVSGTSTSKWASSKKVSTFFRSRQSSTNKIKTTENFGVILKVPPNSIAQINLFKETYPLELKWLALFYMEGSLEITWRVFNANVTRNLDVVQILINEARKIYTVGKSKVGNRDRIVSMLTTRSMDSSNPNAQSRTLDDSEMMQGDAQMLSALDYL